MSRRKRVDLGGALRRKRALMVALGSRRYRWRPLDVGPGRPHAGFPRVVRSFSDVLRLAHEWLLKNRPNASSWWFHVQELAYDAGDRYAVVVKYTDVLVYRETLFDARRDPYCCSNRKAACCG